MSNGRLALGAEDLGVEVDQAGHRADQDPHRLGLGEGDSVEVVVEAAQGVVVGHQPQLGAAVPARAVGADVAQDVLVSGVENIRN